MHDVVSKPWLPDLCRLPRIAAALAVAEMVVILMAITPHPQGLWTFREFIGTSGFALWLALVVAMLLCKSRKWIHHLPMPLGILCSVSLPMALAALSVVGGDDRRAAARRQLDERVAHLRGLGAVVEAAQAAAVVAALENRHIEAAALLQAALASAPAGTSAGWTIPVEPLLGVTARPDVWAPVLSTLRARAA